WRIFNRHRARSRSRQAARVGASSVDRDGAGRGAGGVEGGGVSAARNTAAARGPSTHRYRNIIRAGAGAGDGCRSTGLDRRRARRAGNLRRVLGRFLHGEVGGATGHAVLLGLGIGNGGGGSVAAAADAAGVDGGAGVFAFNLAPVARPRVGERVLGVEVAGGDGRVHRFADHDFGGLHRTGRRYEKFGSSAARGEHQTGAQQGTVVFRTAQRAILRSH